MLRIYSNQLTVHLREGLRACYFLSGNELLILQESQDLIRQAAQKLQFKEYYNFHLHANLDWDAIFSICQTISLFSSGKILVLMLPEKEKIIVIEDQLIKLFSFLNKDILLILRGPRLTNMQENSNWFKIFSSQNSVYVSCQTIQKKQLPHWVSARAKIMKLELDNTANLLLCYCYEGNLLALSQALERLSLLYPDGKLTLLRVEQAVDDEAHFMPFHLMDAILAGKSQRTWHILQKLRQEDIELIIILRSLQRELLLLLTLQRRMTFVPLSTLFDQHNVWMNRRHLIIQAVQRLSISDLHRAIKQLAQIELNLKNNYNQFIWQNLESLSMLLCSTNSTYEFCIYDS